MSQSRQVFKNSGNYTEGSGIFMICIINPGIIIYMGETINLVLSNYEH